MIIRHGIACCALLALLALTGCATRTYRADAAGPSAAHRAAYQAQVAIGQCAFKPGTRDPAVAGAIATALAASAVTQGVNYLGRALDEAAKGANDRITASRNLEVTAQTFGPCVQVIRGWFHRGFDSAARQADALQRAQQTWARGGAVDAAKLATLWQRRLWLAAPPDFVFEAEILVTDLAVKPNTTVLTLVPVYARLDAPISKAALRPSTDREVAVFFAFHEATADPAAPSNAAGGLSLGRLETAVDVHFPPPDTWSDTPNRSAAESRWFTLALPTARKPMALTALVTEHQDSSAFMQFLADVLTGARSPVASALQSAIVPDLRAEAEESETARLAALQTAYEESLSRAMAAATACSAKVADALDAASDVRGRARTFNRNARALGRRPVNEDLVPLSIDPGAVQAGCARLREALRAVI